MKIKYTILIIDLILAQGSCTMSWDSIFDSYLKCDRPLSFSRWVSYGWSLLHETKTHSTKSIRTRLMSILSSIRSKERTIIIEVQRIPSNPVTSTIIIIRCSIFTSLKMKHETIKVNVVSPINTPPNQIFQVKLRWLINYVNLYFFFNGCKLIQRV